MANEEKTEVWGEEGGSHFVQPTALIHHEDFLTEEEDIAQYHSDVESYPELYIPYKEPGLALLGKMVKLPQVSHCAYSSNAISRTVDLTVYVVWWAYLYVIITGLVRDSLRTSSCYENLGLLEVKMANPFSKVIRGVHISTPNDVLYEYSEQEQRTAAIFWQKKKDAEEAAKARKRREEERRKREEEREARAKQKAWNDRHFPRMRALGKRAFILAEAELENLVSEQTFRDWNNAQRGGRGWALEQQLEKTFWNQIVPKYSEFCPDVPYEVLWKYHFGSFARSFESSHYHAESVLGLDTCIGYREYDDKEWLKDINKYLEYSLVKDPLTGFASFYQQLLLKSYDWYDPNEDYGLTEEEIRPWIRDEDEEASLWTKETTDQSTSEFYIDLAKVENEIQEENNCEKALTFEQGSSFILGR